MEQPVVVRWTEIRIHQSNAFWIRGSCPSRLLNSAMSRCPALVQAIWRYSRPINQVSLHQMEFISNGEPKPNEVGNRWYFQTNASGRRYIKSHTTVALKLFCLWVVMAAECLFLRMCRCVTGWRVPDVSEHRGGLIFKGRNVCKKWISNNDATPRPNFERRPQTLPCDNLKTHTIDCEGWYTASLVLGGKSNSLILIYVKQQISGKISWSANRYSTFSWKKNGTLNMHDKVTRLLRNVTNKCTLFKLMFEFNFWRLLRVSNIMCLSSGRPFVYADLYGAVSYCNCNKTISVL